MSPSKERVRPDLRRDVRRQSWPLARRRDRGGSNRTTVPVFPARSVRLLRAFPRRPKHAHGASSNRAAYARLKPQRRYGK